MNKLMTKKIWTSETVATPDYIYLKVEHNYEEVKSILGDVFVVKPSREGSSLGIHKITSEKEFEFAVKDANQFAGSLMAEQWIQGEEYTVGILNDEPLPVIKLKTTHAFYDFEAKYRADDTQYILPCGLSEVQEAELQQKALSAFTATDASGWGRVDVMMDKDQKPWFLEVNTVPGMTDHSLVPMAAAFRDISFEQLVLKILDTTL